MSEYEVRVLRCDVDNPSPDGRKRERFSKSTLPAGLRLVLRSHTYSGNGLSREFSLAPDQKDCWQDRYAVIGQAHDLFKLILDNSDIVEPTTLEWLNFNGMEHSMLIALLDRGIISRETLLAVKTDEDRFDEEKYFYRELFEYYAKGAKA
jgi:hypothetical protein